MSGRKRSFPEVGTLCQQKKADAIESFRTARRIVDAVLQCGWLRIGCDRRSIKLTLNFSDFETTRSCRWTGYFLSSRNALA